MSIIRKKLLFINPAVEEGNIPHYGLAMLGTILQNRGHLIRVADYYYSQKIPPLQGILNMIKPDVIGFSLVSSLWEIGSKWIEYIRRKNPEVPIICGGPHVSCYYDDLIRDNRIDYLVVGEAESVIVDLIEKAERQDKPKLIGNSLPDIYRLPLPDYSLFYDHEGISVYPLVTSRGCPYGCSFCAVGVTNSRKWRARAVESCIEELSGLREILPGVEEVVIWDDNFTLDLERGKELIREYVASGIRFPLRPANMRADQIDEELVQLLKSAGCEVIQLGAEHGDVEVFSSIGKGETLEDIRRAGQIAKENGMELILSFIIGLPGDSLRKTLASVRLARELKADRCYWNILVPYRGTKSYEYFKSRGRLDESRIPQTLVSGDKEEWPNADTTDFTAAERLKAKHIAGILSGQLSFKNNLGFLTISALRYGFLKEWCIFLYRKFVRKLIRCH